MRKLTKNNVTNQDWYEGIKPFDMMTCRDCLSLHRSFLTVCRDPEHQIVKDAVDKLNLTTPSGYASFNDFQKQFPVFVKLRKRFAKFYTKAGK